MEGEAHFIWESNRIESNWVEGKESPLFRNQKLIMALATASATASTCSCSSQLLPRPKFSTLPFPIPFANRSRYRRLSISFVAAAAAKKDSNDIQSENNKKKKKKQVEVEEEEEVEEVEEELPWLQEKALDVVEFTGSVTQAIPGPRVGTSSLPWILAIPLAYAGLTFLIALVKTVKKLSSPREKRRKLVNKNAFLCKSIDQQLHSLTPDALKALEKKTGFVMEEILRKYIRYALNEKPFNPDLVAHLIHLRKASMLDDSQVASILNDISARIVRDKGTYIFIFIF